MYSLKDIYYDRIERQELSMDMKKLLEETRISILLIEQKLLGNNMEFEAEKYVKNTLEQRKHAQKRLKGLIKKNKKYNWITKIIEILCRLFYEEVL